MGRIKSSLFMIILIGFVFLLSGCRTISSLKMSPNTAFLHQRQYDNVIVEKFNNKVATTDTDRGKIDWACNSFADYIVQELRSTDAFARVTREGRPTKSSLLIGGDLTKYYEGDVMGKALIGFGMGSSYFDSLVKFSDGATGRQIGTIEVDENSWLLGGWIAAGQTTEAFMRGAARKIAEEAKKLTQVSARGTTTIAAPSRSIAERPYTVERPVQQKKPVSPEVCGLGAAERLDRLETFYKQGKVSKAKYEEEKSLILHSISE